MTEKCQITFIGTGSMRKPMVHELLKHGYPVRVYDRRREAAKTVVAAGAVWADTPRESALAVTQNMQQTLMQMFAESA